MYVYCSRVNADRQTGRQAYVQITKICTPLGDGVEATNLGQFVHGFLQLSLFLVEGRLGGVQSLTLRLDDPVDPTIEFHCAHPHA